MKSTDIQSRGDSVLKMLLDAIVASSKTRTS